MRFLPLLPCRPLGWRMLNFTFLAIGKGDSLLPELV